MVSDSRIVFPRYWIEASVKLSGLPEGSRRHLGAVITCGKWNSRRNGLAAHDIGRAQRITTGSCRPGPMFVWKHNRAAWYGIDVTHSATRRCTHLAARRRTSCGVAGHSTVVLYHLLSGLCYVYDRSVQLYYVAALILCMLQYECIPICVWR